MRPAALLEWPAMQRIRLASVSFLNALPLTWGLSHGRLRDRVDLRSAPPHECARLLQEGLVDVALIPSIEFARTTGLAAVPGTGVSSREEVRSVLVVTRTEPASIRNLAVDLNSRTSVALARLILRRRYGCRPVTTPMSPLLEDMLRHSDAALLIGDPALRASVETAANGSSLRVMDLAREWNEMTQMPFVFALWACRPVVDITEMRALLDESLEEGLRHIDGIAAEQSERSGLPAAIIASYLRRNIHYRLGPAESDSLRVFFRMCREEGMLSAQERGALSGRTSASANNG